MSPGAQNCRAHEQRPGPDLHRNQTHKPNPENQNTPREQQPPCSPVPEVGLVETGETRHRRRRPQNTHTCFLSPLRHMPSPPPGNASLAPGAGRCVKDASDQIQPRLRSLHPKSGGAEALRSPWPPAHSPHCLQHPCLVPRGRLRVIGAAVLRLSTVNVATIVTIVPGTQIMLSPAVGPSRSWGAGRRPPPGLAAVATGSLLPPRTDERRVWTRSPRVGVSSLSADLPARWPCCHPGSPSCCSSPVARVASPLLGPSGAEGLLWLGRIQRTECQAPPGVTSRYPKSPRVASWFPVLKSRPWCLLGCPGWRC